MKLIAEWIEWEQPLYAKDIYDIADSEDITKRTLCRARTRLGIQVERTENGYIWILANETKTALLARVVLYKSE